MTAATATKDMLTTKGDTYCPIRMIMFGSYVVLTLCAVGGFIIECYAYLDLVKHLATNLPAPPKFDSVGYGTAITGVTAGGGIGIAFKQKDEPSSPGE